jgi:hypothetical protein
LTNYYREYSARVNVHHGFGASDSNVSSTGLVVKCRDGHPYWSLTASDTPPLK